MNPYCVSTEIPAASDWLFAVEDCGGEGFVLPGLTGGAFLMLGERRVPRPATACRLACLAVGWAVDEVLPRSSFRIKMINQIPGSIKHSVNISIEVSIQRYLLNCHRVSPVRVKWHAARFAPLSLY